MRVGVYIDGFNLYYGGRRLCGRGVSGWRWLDVRALASALVGRSGWSEAALERVIYCTARIDGAENLAGQQEQDVYLKALVATSAVDHIEFGHFVTRVKKSPLAKTDSKGRPELVRSSWPVQVQTSEGEDVRKAKFMVSTAMREEKGSDVNVASHLLTDVLLSQVDAAIVVSNDSDLRLPVQIARLHVPVGIVNPSPNQLAGDLRGQPEDGVGCHWWYKLKTSDFFDFQLSDPSANFTKPPAW